MGTMQCSSLPYRRHEAGKRQATFGTFGAIWPKRRIVTLANDLFRDNVVWIRIQADDGVERKDDLKFLKTEERAHAEALVEASLAHFREDATPAQMRAIDPDDSGLVATIWYGFSAAFEA